MKKMRKKRKVNMKAVIPFLLVLIVIISLIFLFINASKKVDTPSPDKDEKFISLVGYNIEDAKAYLNDNNISFVVVEVSSDVAQGEVIEQSVKEGTFISQVQSLKLTVSKGQLTSEDYAQASINELGRIPVMMYHGIHNRTNDSTDYTGGNVDKDGYQRTTEAFRNDLEFYYESGYRMIRLEDYVNGKIDVSFGYSPIVITFDDGLENNIKILGLDANGSIIIDPNSAVGILEEFKAKYPDYNVTATFFVNGGLFQQTEYNEAILKWLVDNGYDIGNHSYSHSNFKNISEDKSISEIARIYQLLDSIIPNKYVNIVALPFGSPGSKDHVNFSHIISGTYNGYSYNTICTLRVGWESDYSPFSSNFDPTYIKRIRAYDNNGVEFDIAHNFKNLENNKYISDGDINVITVPSSYESKVVNNYNLKIKTY